MHSPRPRPVLLVHHRTRPDRDGPDIKVYGSGLLSFYGEIEHATSSPDVQRHPHQLEWVINQPFEIDSYQPLLFIANDFEHVFTKVDTLAL